MGPVTYCRRSGRRQRAWKGVVAVDGSPKKWAGLVTINRTLINTHIRQKLGKDALFISNEETIPWRGTSNRYQLQNPA